MASFVDKIKKQLTPARPLSREMRRARVSWYFYDFGNSAYAAVVLLAVYSAYFQQEVVGGPEGSRLWGIAVGVAMLIVALTTPILGSIADFSASKKQFLLVYTLITILFTGLLFFVTKGDIFLGMLLFIIAETGYRSAQVFYNALLVDIADDSEEMGRISGNGWAIGSFGGIICLLLIIAIIKLTENTFDPTLIKRLSMIIAAVFFGLSSIPIFLLLKERIPAQKMPEGSTYMDIVLLPFKRIRSTFRDIKSFRQLVKFIIAFTIYNNGIMMALNFASIYGALMYGLQQQQLVIFMIIVQFTSVIGAWIFGWLADRFSGKYALIVSIVLMIAAIAWLVFNFNHSLSTFYVIGGMVGFTLTGVQSISRMMVGKLSPPEKSSEFYGFFAVSGSASSFIGPTIYGLVASGLAIRSTPAFGEELALKYGQQAGMLSVILFLIAGLVILFFVNEKKGKANAARKDIS